MSNSIQHFLQMGGYGFYVWGSYGVVIAALIAQWIMPWRRRKQYLKKQTHE